MIGYLNKLICTNDMLFLLMFIFHSVLRTMIVLGGLKFQYSSLQITVEIACQIPTVNAVPM